MSESFEQEFTQMMTSRRSIRAFLPQRVDQALMDKIFEMAASAPSNCNTQPWETYVVSGESRDKMSQLLLETVGQGKYSLDYPYDAKYEGVYRQRQVDVGTLLYEALGVTREDKEGKKNAFLRNLEFFGAPHAAFIFMPDWSSVREASDVGMFAQNLILAMEAHGISSCPQTILSYNADGVREFLGVDPGWKLLFGISFGYADNTQPENKICPTRAELAESTHFLD